MCHYSKMLRVYCNSHDIHCIESTLKSFHCTMNTPIQWVFFKQWLVENPACYHFNSKSLVVNIIVK